MNIQRLIGSLGRTPAVVRAYVCDLSPEEARWRPPEGTWSVLEIVTHLADEEVEDFRRRVELTLGDPTAQWPAIDPEGWAVERKYNEGNLDAALDRFTEQRRASITWLRSLSDPDWSRAYEHPKFGAIRAGDLLVSWAAHDALHLRQLAKRMYQRVEHDGSGFSTSYAGEWRA